MLAARLTRLYSLFFPVKRGLGAAKTRIEKCCRVADWLSGGMKFHFNYFFFHDIGEYDFAAGVELEKWERKTVFHMKHHPDRKLELVLRKIVFESLEWAVLKRADLGINSKIDIYYDKNLDFSVKR